MYVSAIFAGNNSSSCNKDSTGTNINTHIWNQPQNV